MGTMASVGRDEGTLLLFTTARQTKACRVEDWGYSAVERGYDPPYATCETRGRQLQGDRRLAASGFWTRASSES